MGRGIPGTSEMVSAVIPTRGRSHLILRAVESALAQTYEPMEVVVIVDGPDEATTKVLERVDDPRLRVVTLPTNVGEMNARNAGVDEARGTWVAFLDDDDEMLPGRLHAQVDAAHRSPYACPIVVSRFIARTHKGEFVWPRRLTIPPEPLSEYLFTRTSLLGGERDIDTSLYFAKKQLFKAVPFRSDVQIHGDWEWLLRANAARGVGIEFVPEPLVVRQMTDDYPRVSNSPDWNWRRSLAWIREHRDLVTPRAYAGFVLTMVGSEAAKNGEWKTFLPLLREAVRLGKPNVIELLFYAWVWLVPREARGRLRSLLPTKDRTGGPPRAVAARLGRGR